MGAPLRVAIVAPFGLRPKGTTISRALPIAQVLACQGASVRLVIPPWPAPHAESYLARPAAYIAIVDSFLERYDPTFGGVRRG